MAPVPATSTQATPTDQPAPGESPATPPGLSPDAPYLQDAEAMSREVYSRVDTGPDPIDLYVTNQDWVGQNAAGTGSSNPWHAATMCKVR